MHHIRILQDLFHDKRNSKYWEFLNYKNGILNKNIIYVYGQCSAIRIRFILVRIRILGLVPLTNGSGWGCGSVPKNSVTFRMQKIFQCFNQWNLKSFDIVKICLMIIMKFLSRKFLYYSSPLNSPYLWLTDPGGPKTYGSGTLAMAIFFYLFMPKYEYCIIISRLGIKGELF